MENTKAKNVIIGVLVVLLLVVTSVLILNVAKNSVTTENTASNVSNTQENGEQQGELTAANSIEDAQVTGVQDIWYTGNKIEQNIKVTVNDEELVNKTDYTVTYKNNINPGTATIIIEGIGKYQGTKEVTFTIKDQYANYKDKNIKWATSSYSFGKGSDLKIYIEKGKVYLNNSKAKKINITGLSGTPKKVYIPFSQATGDLSAYILTSNGNLYRIDDVYFQKKFTPKKIKTGVVDFAISGGVVPISSIYVLSNGQLTTLDGFSFEKINQNFVKDIELDYEYSVYLDKDGYMYMDTYDYNYYKFESIKPSKIFRTTYDYAGKYDNPEENYILVLGNNNKLYKIKRVWDSKYRISGYVVTNLYENETVKNLKYTKETVYDKDGKVQVNSLEIEFKAATQYTEYNKAVIHNIELLYYYDVAKDKRTEPKSVYSKHDVYDISSNKVWEFNYDGVHTLYIDSFNYVYFKNNNNEYVRLSNLKVNKIYYYNCNAFIRLLLVGDYETVVIDNLDKYTNYQYKYNLIDMTDFIEMYGEEGVNYRNLLQDLISESNFALKSVYDVNKHN